MTNTTTKIEIQADVMHGNEYLFEVYAGYKLEAVPWCLGGSFDNEQNEWYLDYLEVYCAGEKLELKRSNPLYIMALKVASVELNKELNL